MNDYLEWHEAESHLHFELRNGACSVCADIFPVIATDNDSVLWLCTWFGDDVPDYTTSSLRSAKEYGIQAFRKFTEDHRRQNPEMYENDKENVDVTMWEEFCAAGASAEAFEAEFRRVFGSCNVAFGGNVAFGAVFADGWPEPVRYDAAKALPVLARFDDGHGATEKGDAEVCAALEAAGKANSPRTRNSAQS